MNFRYLIQLLIVEDLADAKFQQDEKHVKQQEKGERRLLSRSKCLCVLAACMLPTVIFSILGFLLVLT